MQKKTDQHVFQGMQRDMSISKQKAEFLWDANNIRLTARHGDTLFSITNERGTKRIDNVVFEGVVIGYCVLGNYLTVFTTSCSEQLEKPDHIYRVEKTDAGYILEELYNGNLNFNTAHPIECLGVYENVDIQKVYWTDGLNQPRFINIKKRLLDGTYTDTSFDFIPTLELKDSIHVKKVADSSGLFAAGVIQYAVTYYNKYGQESNISVVSPLIPTSYTARAGGPEDTIGNAFKVTVRNPDVQFEFLRLYSIFRSSKDTTPVCKRVADIRLGYGGHTSSKLVISSDSQSVWYARVDADVQFRSDYEDEYKDLQDAEGCLGQSTIVVGGITFNALKYYHFSKSEYPNLILKAITYDNTGRVMKYFTWDTCTDIYISTEVVQGPGTGHPIIWAGGGTSKMTMADNIYYTYDNFVNVDPETNTASVTITDNGTIGDEVDYNELLFVGGEEITAQTITQKDGTLFLGGITIARPQIDGAYDGDGNAKNDDSTLYKIQSGTSINKEQRSCWYPLNMNDSYLWGNPMFANVYRNEIKLEESTNTAGFKYGEHYRLGLQFQYKTGKWSQPVFIKDEISDKYMPSLDMSDGYCRQNIPSFNAAINKDAGDQLIANGYIRVRGVVCFPTLSDQLILCQGVLNSTVYSAGNRANHTPDSQSSWFYRPIIDPTKGYRSNSNEYIPQGEYVQYRHNYIIDGSNRRYGELQSVEPLYQDAGPFKLQYGNYDYTRGTFRVVKPTGWPPDGNNIKSDNTTKIESLADYTDMFAVDANVLTMNSPEFEFNDSFNSMDLSGFKCRCIGKSLISSTQGNIHITTSSPPISPNGGGFYHRTTKSDNSRRLCSGLFYRDGYVWHRDEDGKGLYEEFSGTGTIRYQEEGSTETEVLKIKTRDALIGELGFMVYPWHRSGSLNNDSARSDGSLRSALLGHKVISNLMFSYGNDLYQPNAYQDLMPMTEDTEGCEMKIFNSDQISLVKIGGLNYYGNFDQLIPPTLPYPICFGWKAGPHSSASFLNVRPMDQDNSTPISSSIYNLGWLSDDQVSGPIKGVACDSYTNALCQSSEGMMMKYKSTPHAVLHLGKHQEEQEVAVDETEEEVTYETQLVDVDNVIDTYPQDPPNRDFLYLAEIYRDSKDTDFGGKSQDAIQSNLWYPAGPAVRIGCDIEGNVLSGEKEGTTVVPLWYGDTYYARYDCLKTYPFTDEDPNSIIEIGSFMLETKVNVDGRYDKNRGDISNFMLNPTNFNLINPVYSQMDNFFNYRILDDDYYALSNYPTMVTWTGYKNNAAEVDSWTNITLASTLEMDGTKGKVNAVRVNSDQLYCFQDDAIGQILFNSRVQISPSDGVPIEISNNYKVDGNRYISTSIGCKNKWTITEGVDGLYFIDSNTKALYQLGAQSQLKPISTPLNMSYWFMTQDCGTPWIQHHWDNGYEFRQQGIRCFYDNTNADLYICTPEETLCYSEKLGQFVSFFDYHNVIGMFNIDTDYFALNYPDNSSEPHIYLWGMAQGLYNTFFDKIYQSDFTFISNENPLNDKIFTNIELRGDFRWWERNIIEEDFNSPTHSVDHRRMFDTVRVWNEYQDTGEIDLTFKQDVPSNMKKKFRVWRMDIPRDKDHVRQRIRNTWAKVKFTMNSFSATSLQDLCGKITNEFVVWDNATGSWKDLDFKGINTQFVYEDNCIVEKTLGNDQTGNESVVAYYEMKGDIITRRIPGSQLSSMYAYRRLYDMEIHDIGVVYYL